jgi:hypothetical protein
VRLTQAITGILLAALLALPAGAAAKRSAGPVGKLAAQQCKQERQQLGRKAFRKRYGARNQMRNCIKRNRSRVQTAARSATSECEAKLAELGVAGFIEEFGSDDTGDDAMAECILEWTDRILNPEAYEGADDEWVLDDE